jgi:8-oxo-dGTP pyrophosphatase MutT (NUDIX family)
VIPVRWFADQLHVLLITSRHDPQRWIIPKGWIETRLTSSESAVKEAYEEAGVTGRLDPNSLGSYLHRRGEESHEVEVFRLDVERVLDAWPEEKDRDRRWFTMDEALERLDSPRLCRMLRTLQTQTTGVVDPAFLSCRPVEACGGAGMHT